MDKVLVTRKIPERLLQSYRDKWDIVMWPHEEIEMEPSTLKKELASVSAVLTVLADRINKDVIDSASSHLKVIANMAVGYDNVDVSYAQEKGIIVTNTPDILTETTADLTFGLLLATARNLIKANNHIKDGKWTNWSPYFLAGSDVHHKTIGIVGMGRIGKAIANRAKGFNMNVLYHNRNRVLDAETEIGAKYVSFEELLASSDYVVCMTPLTDSTKEMFNRDVFRQMKESAIFINTSRGGTVNEHDLYEALKHNEIRAAGLDVFQNEPIHVEHPLLELENVTALPHIGSATFETRDAMIDLCLQNIEAVLSGKAPLTPVK